MEESWGLVQSYIFSLYIATFFTSLLLYCIAWN